VTSSDVVIDYLLEDGREFGLDLRLELGGEMMPEVGRLGGHNTSYCVASVTRSLTAWAVSLVRAMARDGIRLVAGTGMRKSMA
jgi:hypothetical protein